MSSFESSCRSNCRLTHLVAQLNTHPPSELSDRLCLSLATEQQPTLPRLGGLVTLTPLLSCLHSNRAVVSRQRQSSRCHEKGGPKMDDYMFRSYVTQCTCVQEATSYLEIFNYSVSCPVFLTSDGLRQSVG